MAIRKNDLDNEQVILEHADRYAIKDATLNMRISSQLLEDLKDAAKIEGIEKYQTWVTMILHCAVAEAKSKA